MTKGARDMLSTPPASTSPASPLRKARAAVPMASSPEPHKRLMVIPGTDTGSPANNSDIRATLRLSSPRSEEHTSELQSRGHLVCRLLLEKKKIQISLVNHARNNLN